MIIPFRQDSVHWKYRKRPSLYAHLIVLDSWFYCFLTKYTQVSYLFCHLFSAQSCLFANHFIVAGMASVENGTPPAASKSKKTAVEEIYQKKSQLEHILLRPDTYIGKNF